MEPLFDLELTKDEIEWLLNTMGEPEDHYGDPLHPARTIKEKLLCIETDT